MEHVSAAQRFALEHVAPLADLSAREVFPLDLWAEMARAGLLGLYLPADAGGGGLASPALIEAGEAYVRAGGNLGMASAWFGHSAVARFLVAGFANAGQRARLLPALAAGSLTAAVAISEPKAGAHPKLLRTRARREGGGWLLDGEKAYVTNGPFAQVVIVVAITSEAEGRKRFSAFLVPRDAPGLTIAPMPPLDFLRPAQHAHLMLEGCAVGQDALLGEEGEAFERMARPLRDVEDTLNAGPLLGALGFQLDGLVARLGEREEPPDAALGEALGGLEARLAALRAIARRGGEVLDGSATAPELTALALAFRTYAREFQQAWRAACETGRVGEVPRAAAMGTELERVLGLARTAVLLKQRRIGERLLRGER